jgi:hypothetical protein
MQKIRQAGCANVGLVISDEWDQSSSFAWSSRFFVEQVRNRCARENSVFRLRGGSIKKHADALNKWRTRFKPDALLGLAPDLEALLRCADLVGPRVLACADLDLPQPGGALAGVCMNHERVGELAVENLAMRLQRREFGLRRVLVSVAVAGTWSDGASLPAQRTRPVVSPVEPITSRDLMELALIG